MDLLEKGEPLFDDQGSKSDLFCRSEKRSIKGDGVKSTVGFFLFKIPIIGSAVASAIVPFITATNPFSIEVGNLNIISPQAQFSREENVRTLYLDVHGHNIMSKERARRIFTDELRLNPGLDAHEISVKYNLSLKFAVDICNELHSESIIEYIKDEADGDA